MHSWHRSLLCTLALQRSMASASQKRWGCTWLLACRVAQRLPVCSALLACPRPGGQCGLSRVPCTLPSLLSPQVDVYSFAVLLWEMLTGRVPWRELAGHMQIIFQVGVLRQVSEGRELPAEGELLAEGEDVCCFPGAVHSSPQRWMAWAQAPARH